MDDSRNAHRPNTVIITSSNVDIYSTDSDRQYLPIISGTPLWAPPPVPWAPYIHSSAAAVPRERLSITAPPPSRVMVTLPLRVTPHPPASTIRTCPGVPRNRTQSTSRKTGDHKNPAVIRTETDRKLERIECHLCALFGEVTTPTG